MFIKSRFNFHLTSDKASNQFLSARNCVVVIRHRYLVMVPWSLVIPDIYYGVAQGIFETWTTKRIVTT